MSGRHPGLRVLRFGAATCVACCVDPILSVFAGASRAGLASTTVIGDAGIAVAVTDATGAVESRTVREVAG